MKFELPKLDYAYDALEPNIDAKTMEIHHSKHHNGYTNNLNNALEGSPLNGKTIEEICKSDGLSGALRNNGGGYYNHCLFWNILSPNGGGNPNNEIPPYAAPAIASVQKPSYREIINCPPIASHVTAANPIPNPGIIYRNRL